MKPQIQIFAIACALMLAALVLQLVKKRKLREEYSLLWLMSIIVVGAFAFHRPLVASFASWIGVSYAPSAIFIVAFVVGFFLVLHFSIAISRLVERDKRLTQEIGLLRLKLEEMEPQKANSVAEHTNE